MPRLHVLDSVRGLAALSVLLHHCLEAFPVFLAADLHLNADFGWAVQALTYSPLHLFWAGYEPVILFFVLSGFVLALPFFEGRGPSYASFAIKRVFRIYVPYIVVMGIAGLLAHSSNRGGVDPGFTGWVGAQWHDPLTLSDAGNLALMRVDMTSKLDASAWSLYHEMRISLVFPLLVLALSRFGTAFAAVLAVSLFVLGYAANGVGVLAAYELDYTIHFAGMFVLGILVARHRRWLCSQLRRLGPVGWSLFGVVLLFTYLYQWLLVPVLRIQPGPVADPIVDFTAAIAASGCIIGVLTFGRLGTALSWPLVRWFGRISYSLYLVHMVVILAVARLTLGVVAPAVAVCIAALLSLLAAAAMHHAVEDPSRRLGHYLSNFRLWARRPISVSAAQS